MDGTDAEEAEGGMMCCEEDREDVLLWGSYQSAMFPWPLDPWCRSIRRGLRAGLAGDQGGVGALAMLTMIAIPGSQSSQRGVGVDMMEAERFQVFLLLSIGCFSSRAEKMDRKLKELQRL